MRRRCAPCVTSFCLARRYLHNNLIASIGSGTFSSPSSLTTLCVPLRCATGACCCAGGSVRCITAVAICGASVFMCGGPVLSRSSTHTHRATRVGAHRTLSNNQISALGNSTFVGLSQLAHLCVPRRRVGLRCLVARSGCLCNARVVLWWRSGLPCGAAWVRRRLLPTCFFVLYFKKTRLFCFAQ